MKNVHCAGIGLFTLSVLMGAADTVQFGAPAKDSSSFTSIERKAGEDPAGLSGGISPFALALVPPAEMPAETYDIYGFRLSIFVGKHRDVGYVDVGTFGSLVTGNLSGVQVSGLYNRIGESDGAIEIGGLLNYCERDFTGVQVAGFLNTVLGDMEGLQVSLVNTAADFSGLQIGAINRIERGSGLQIGVVNYAYQLEGLQLGLININSGSTVPCMVGLNFAF